ncbi:MAG: flavin reductase family protein [Dehalococcoidales bacterium]|nr:flavin reductase family protein [Dehalococcoidales bacterium]
MNKLTIGPGAYVFPQPVFLIGSNVNDHPNFMTASWGGMACGTPPMLSVAIRPQRYTLKGIRQNNVFSVNIPSEDMVEQADYFGIVSGTSVDKAETCGIDVFYGKLEKAPMILQCPINLECKVVHMLNLGSHLFVVGSIEETHINEDCLTDGKPDVDKIKPILYSRGVFARYYAFGDSIADAFGSGNIFKNAK